MRAEVWTARVSSRDPDRFDITRGSGGAQGDPFAPSWAILRPAKRMLAEDTAAGWAWYEPRYMAEMRTSYATNPADWATLLRRSRVVLVCYCTDSARCHRTLLAGILGKLGADVRGEVPS